MLQDITDDMDNDEELDENDTPADDNGVLTGEQVQELATMRPLLVYEQTEDKKVKVAELETVRPPTGANSGPNRFSIRIQGVRKGELTYNAKRTIDELSLVPVFCLMDAKLVDRMRVSPEALALGKAAIDSLYPTAPPINPLVDVLVEEYLEAAPIEREFFLPSEGGDDAVPTMGSDMPSVEEVIAHLSDPTTSPSFMSTLSNSDYQLVELPMMSEDVLNKVPAVIPEPALIEDGDGTVHVSDNLDASAYQSPEALSVHPDRSTANTDLVDTAVEPMAVPGEGAAYSIDPMGLPVIETTPTLEPGVLEDGTTVPFDPRLHQLPM